MIRSGRKWSEGPREMFREEAVQIILMQKLAIVDPAVIYA